MISTRAWEFTVIALAIIVALDFAWAILRRNSHTTLKEASIWSLFYVGLAVSFGLFLGTWTNSNTQQEFFAGWLTEYSLSFDNLFVFVIILAKFKIKEESKQLVLLLGILIALVFRVIAITLGAAAIEAFEWVFFIFGAFLIFTAYKLFGESGHEEEDVKDSKFILFMQNKGFKPFTIALISLGITDIVFALDSIPAIFGLTQNVYVVITANVFALMGLRQLYFLIGGLMKRLVYIGKALSIILGFIGVKLFFHAMHAYDIHKLGAIKLPEFTIAHSLGFIVTVLTIATVASLTKTKDSKNV
jgi:tellurite resistance protein TerC